MLSAITSHVLTLERTVKLNSTRETSRNAQTLKKIDIFVQQHRNLNSRAIRLTSQFTTSPNHISKL